MQKTLYADPPDAEPPPDTYSPFRHTPGCRPPPHPPVNRQTGVKTLPCPKLRLREVTTLDGMIAYNYFYCFICILTISDASPEKETVLLSELLKIIVLVITRDILH